MKVFLERLIAASLTFTIGMAAPIPWFEEAIEEQTETDELRVIIPEDIRSSHYLGLIDQFESYYDLPKLRESTLPGDDIEIRVYVSGFTLGTDVLILRRTSDKWQGTHYSGMTPRISRHFNGVSPLSNWSTIWKRLKEAGILSLSGTKDSRVQDGVVYIVETNLNKTYLAYAFANPAQLEDEDGTKMVTIARILAEEFAIESFHP